MALPDLTQLTLLALESARLGDAQTLRDALAAGVEVDARNADGDSLLILACRHDHVDLARLLLERGADRSIRGGAGTRAIDIARAMGAADVVSLLDANR